MDSKNEDCHIVPFEPAHGSHVLGWVRSAQELSYWAGREDYPLTDTSVFSTWHAEPDVQPYTLLVDGELHGYGEIWLDRSENETELARLMIAPQHRRRGLGSALVRLLVEKCAGLGFSDVWMRVVPENAGAIACYETCGFRRADPAEEATFNADQPRPYHWMRREARG